MQPQKKKKVKDVKNVSRLAEVESGNKQRLSYLRNEGQCVGTHGWVICLM